MKASLRLWALALVATTAISLALAKADAGANQVPKQQEPVSKSKLPIDSQQAVSFKQSHQQQVAEKKQGDQVIDSLFNSEEYVQIKPEEITSDAAAKDIDPALMALADLPASPSGQAGQPAQAEHKSAADEELSAHLAQDSIGALESAPSSYNAPPADPRAARPHGASARGGYLPPRHPSPNYGPRPAATPSYAGPRPMLRPRQPYKQPPTGGRYPGGPPHLPSGGYASLKGKIAGGLSSIVPHAPRPAHYGQPGHPTAHAGPPSRYLPRGAAAGYAAFREFVRAQAHRYKGQQPQQSAGSHEPAAYNAAPPSGSSYGSAQGSVEMVGGSGYRAPAAAAEQKPQVAEHAAVAAKPAEQQYGAPAAPVARNKVTVAQAYIPNLALSDGPAGPYGQSQAGAPATGPYGSNSAIAELYGGHAPRGVGRPEYNKDYGMVIHYPQATVYTEPMTVDQLHKLAGSSITQILEQLQYSLASGQRNEANTLRANNKHHLGHGLAIHAKEYYAPGKGGQYVPTTAAVISSHAEPQAESPAYASQAGPHSNGAGYSSELPRAPQDYRPTVAGPYQAGSSAETAQYGFKPELGSGYERVKAAVAASAMKYGGSRPAGEQQPHYNNQQQHRQPAAHYEGPAGLPQVKPYEPLGALANIIGSELESLYNKANSVLAKQIDPEIHAHVQAHLKTLAKVAVPLKIGEQDYRPAGPPRPHSGPVYGSPPHHQQGSYQGPPRAPRPPHPRGRGPRRPAGYDNSHAQHRPGRHPHPQQQPRPNHQRPGPYQQHQHQQHPNQHHQQNSPHQQQAYNAEQHAFQQQMNQLLNDFNLGEDNYGAKSQPNQATNQGYPSRVIQKYQQQHQQQQQPALSYEHSDGLEIPQGPNDQIGEISELIDALKGTLEGHGKHEAAKEGKLEDVQYIASALGQVPSYAIQVPVAGSQHAHASAEAAVSEAAKKAEQYGPGQQHEQQKSQYQQQGHQQSVGSVGQANQQLPYLAPPAPQAAPAYGSYGAGPSSLDAHAAAYQQQPGASYDQQYKQAAAQQQDSYGGQSSAAPAEAYAPQQQAQEAYAGAQSSGADYGKSSAEPIQQQREQANYGPQSSGPAYQQQPASEPAHQAQSSYTSNENTQVINHLVPVQQQQPQAAAADYGAPQAHPQQQQPQPLSAVAATIAHQPANQISVAAPTESQYQSAQPLSSFVDSLPSDYQELLRQPAPHASILENIAGGHPEPHYSNATAGDIVKTATSLAPSYSGHHHHHHQQQQQQQHHYQSQHSQYHQRPSRHYDSQHLTGAASSPKATYLQVPSSSSSSSKSSAQSPASAAAVSSSVSTSVSTSSSSSSSASQSAPSSAAVASQSSQSSSPAASSSAVSSSASAAKSAASPEK